VEPGVADFTALSPRPPSKGTQAVPERPNPRKGEFCGRSPDSIWVEDAELVARVKQGRTEAYGELVRRYQDRVFNACWRICGHLEDARDLTQEAFLKAFEGLSAFRQQSGFYTWIFRVAVNLSLSHRRSVHRRRTVSLDAGSAVTGTQAEELVKRVRDESGNDPTHGPGDAELNAAVARALQTLDDDQRAVIVLRDIEGFDYREIAAILRIPPGTVKSRLFRARIAMQQAIDPALSPEHSKRIGDGQD